jgi:hypothetical protein
MAEDSLLVGTFKAAANAGWQRARIIPRLPGGEHTVPLDLDAAQSLLANTPIPEGCFRAVLDGKPLPLSSVSKDLFVAGQRVNRLLDPELAWGSFKAGASLIVSGLDYLLPNIRQLCRNLSIATARQSYAFAVFSPSGASGFLPHLDQADQLVVQCVGSKEWRVFPVDRSLPLGAPVDPDGLPSPILETILRKGDMLFLPLGSPHVATAKEELSIHITFALEPSSIGS